MEKTAGSKRGLRLLEPLKYFENLRLKNYLEQMLYLITV